jgi:hypothetical protein
MNWLLQFGCRPVEVRPDFVGAQEPLSSRPRAIERFTELSCPEGAVMLSLRIRSG